MSIYLVLLVILGGIFIGLESVKLPDTIRILLFGIGILSGAILQASS